MSTYAQRPMPMNKERLRLGKIRLMEEQRIREEDQEGRANWLKQHPDSEPPDSVERRIRTSPLGRVFKPRMKRKPVIKGGAVIGLGSEGRNTA